MASDPQIITDQQTQKTPREHSSNNLPYRYGKFQGWLILVSGLVGFVLSSVLLFVDTFKPLRIGVFENMAASIVCARAGYGLLKKKRYGLVLFDIYLVCWLVVVISKYLRFEFTTLQLFVSLATTGLMAAYTNKRIREFA